MVSTNEALNEVRKFKRYFDSLQKIGEFLDGLSSLEQQERDCKDRLQRMRAEEQALKSKIDAAHQSISEAKTNATAIVDDAKLLAEQTIERARQEAVEIERKAKANDAEVRESTLKFKSDIEALTDQRKVELSDLETKIGFAQGKLQVLNEQIEEIRKRVT